MYGLAHSTSLALFGYNRAEGGKHVVKRDKRYVYLDGFEYRLAVVAMNSFRNHLLQTGKPTEDVDVLLLKLLKAGRKGRSQWKTV